MYRLGDKPKYTTGVASQLLDIPVKTLINYENFHLTEVHRSKSGRRLYSEQDLFQILIIKKLMQEDNINLAGIKFLFKLREDVLAKTKVDIYAFIFEDEEIDTLINSVK
jgi:DNA-binding transcriptional MerR regulator